MNLLIALMLLVSPDATPAGTPGVAAPRDLSKIIAPLKESHPLLKKAKKHWWRRQYKDSRLAYNQFIAACQDEELKTKARFMLARMWYDAEAYDKAALEFSALAGALKPLQDWSRYYEGKSWYEAGEYAKSASALARITPGFVKERAAHELMCMAHHKVPDVTAFSTCFEEYEKRFSASPVLLSLQARNLLDAGKKKEAIPLLRTLFVQYPTRREADDAEWQLSKLKKRGFKKQVRVSLAEKLQRAEKLYKRHRYGRCLELTREITDNAKKSSDVWCRALGLRAMATARSRQETASLSYFKRFVGQCPGHLNADVLYRGVDAAYKAGNLNRLEQWANLLVKNFSDSSLCEDALVLLARRYQRKRRPKDVAKTVDLVFANYSKGDMAGEAAWLGVFSAWRSKKYQDALSLAEKYIPVLPARVNYKSDGRLHYWAGRCLQKLKKKKEALSYFTQTMELYPLSWYALLSYLRLEQHKKGLGDKTMASLQKASKPSVPGEQAVLKRGDGLGDRLTPALLFIQMDLLVEARIELDALLRGNKDEQDVEGLLLAAWLFDKAQYYSPAHHTMRRRVTDYGYTYPQDDDPRWFNVSYPLAYNDLARKFGKKSDIPWSLIQAVMREESGFARVIESYAHAQGLMQLLVKTATGMAKREVTKRDLRNAKLNVELGTRYLRYLMNRFGHPALIVAGYNSGPGGVIKTLGRTRNRNIDEFVEYIPYDQTRRYTKRVLSTAWRYQFLYGDKKGAVPFDLTYPKQKPKKKKKRKKSRKKR